jgi:hypothetical protein
VRAVQLESAPVRLLPALDPTCKMYALACATPDAMRHDFINFRLLSLQIVHDFEHRGVTNDYLISSGHDLSILYNDHSPLENHHAAAAFSLLRKPEYNFLAALSKADQARFRKLVIDLVLATDMKQHFHFKSQFTTVHSLPAPVTCAGLLYAEANRRCSHCTSSALHSSGATCAHLSDFTRQHRVAVAALACCACCKCWSAVSRLPCMTSIADLADVYSPSPILAWQVHEQEHVVSCSRASSTTGSTDSITGPLDEHERLLSLQVALKCADIGHLAASLEVSC